MMPPARTVRPAATEYASWYAGYIERVPDGDIVTVLRQGGDALTSALVAIPDVKGDHRYAEGKWTVRTVIGHLIDAERIFAYRALRIARGDSTPLPGFEETDYAAAAGSDARSIAGLASEMHAVRESTVRLFESFPEEAWTRSGTVNNAPVSMRALAWITAGHAMHHLAVLRDHYEV